MRGNLSAVRVVLDALGMLSTRSDSAEDRSQRLDANETVAFSRQLEHVKTEIIETLYPQFRLRDFVPLAGGVSPGDDTFTFRVFNRVGMAEFISAGATDLPLTSEYGTEVSTKIESIGAGYSYTTQDLRRATKLGYPLDSRRGKINREAIERKIDLVGSFGDSARNIPGFLNHANVPLITSGYNGAWDDASTTGADILEDLRAFEFSVINTSKGTHVPTDLLLAPQLYQAATTKEVSTGYPTTALEMFLNTSKNIRRAEMWENLRTADAGADGPRLVMYQKDPMNLELVVPLDYEQFPPQAHGLQFHVPAEGRVGGVVWYRPLGGVYVDGLID